MDHVGGVHLELDRAVERHDELVRADVARIMNRQANCCANTFTFSGSLPASAFFESTTALTIADRDHEDRGDDRPRDLEPGVPVDRRAVRVVVRLHAERPDRSRRSRRATSAKIPMQMMVANQYVNSIRSISSEADSGSQSMRTATRVVTSAASAAITTILTRAPRRITAPRLHQPTWGEPLVPPRAPSSFAPHGSPASGLPAGRAGLRQRRP